MKNNIYFIITGHKLGEKFCKKLRKTKVNYFLMPKCKGFTSDENILDFIGFTELKKCIIIFNSTEIQHKVLLSYILKYHNKKNNGIMFKIEEEKMENENELFIGIVNAGKGEILADIIRKECQSGVTICDARGSGANAKEFLGIRIDSNKEIVFSVMKKEFSSKLKKLITDRFENENTDVVSFNLPISEFNKLHQ